MCLIEVTTCASEPRATASKTPSAFPEPSAYNPSNCRFVTGPVTGCLLFCVTEPQSPDSHRGKVLARCSCRWRRLALLLLLGLSASLAAAAAPAADMDLLLLLLLLLLRL
jgi:hypothetical protein